MKSIVAALSLLILSGCSVAPQGSLPVDTNKDNNGSIVVYNEATKTKDTFGKALVATHALLVALPIPVIAPTLTKAEVVINDVTVGILHKHEPLVLPIKAGTYTYHRLNTTLFTFKAKFTIKPKETKYFYLSNTAGGLQLAETTKESFTRCANTDDLICIPDFIEPDMI